LAVHDLHGESVIMSFDGKILVVGLGAVSRCALPLLFRHLGVPPRRYTVVDRAESDIVADAARRVHESGATFLREEITPGNVPQVLANHVKPGDLVVDVSVNVGSAAMARFCHDTGILYANTSVETWPESADAPRKPPAQRTLYAVHMAFRQMIAGWGTHLGPTAVLDHGANPGLVSHFAKVALQDIANHWLAEHPSGERRERIRESLDHRAWNRLAMQLGVRVIHISERDTQVVDAPKEAWELHNTWSAEAFYAETCHAPVEMGWGTHERRLPSGAFKYRRGPRNQIYLDAAGISTRVRTWVPSGEIVGFVIPHSEAFTISDYLTVREGSRTLYRPTVLFAYRPCDSALASILELSTRDDGTGFRPRVITDEIVAGRDELGVLLMGHDYRTWWTGSVLDIEEARKLAPHQNATTLQVASSLMAACRWVMRNRDRGVCFPDDLPHEEILTDAKPYLGKFISQQVKWSPTEHRDARAADDLPRSAHGDAWQFETFLLHKRRRQPNPIPEPHAVGHDP